MASKRRKRRKFERKTCTSKARHKTLEGAIISIKKGSAMLSMHAYKCPLCDGFHIGHTKKPVLVRKITCSPTPSA